MPPAEQPLIVPNPPFSHEAQRPFMLRADYNKMALPDLKEMAETRGLKVQRDPSKQSPESKAAGIRARYIHKETYINALLDDDLIKKNREKSQEIEVALPDHQSQMVREGEYSTEEPAKTWKQSVINILYNYIHPALWLLFLHYLQDLARSITDTLQERITCWLLSTLFQCFLSDSVSYWAFNTTIRVRVVALARTAILDAILFTIALAKAGLRHNSIDIDLLALPSPYFLLHFTIYIPVLYLAPYCWPNWRDCKFDRRFWARCGGLFLWHLFLWSGITMRGIYEGIPNLVPTTLHDTINLFFKTIRMIEYLQTAGAGVISGLWQK